MSRLATATDQAFASEMLLHLDEPRIPEDRLMLAVLLDAVALLREYAFGTHPHSRRTVIDTLAWFASDDASWPLSFHNVCMGLDLDVQAFRDALDRELASADDWQLRAKGGRVIAFPPATKADPARPKLSVAALRRKIS
jgi:hypothetical protein